MLDKPERAAELVKLDKTDSLVPRVHQVPQEALAARDQADQRASRAQQDKRGKQVLVEVPVQEACLVGPARADLPVAPEAPG